MREGLRSKCSALSEIEGGRNVAEVLEVNETPTWESSPSAIWL